MSRIITAFSLTAIILIPLWIIAVRRQAWQPHIKKIVIAVMTLLSVAFSAYAIFQPGKTQLTIWVGDIATLLYLLVVALTVYYSWPRKNNI
jgi:O-antigen ligase